MRVLIHSNSARGHYHAVVPIAWALRSAGHDIRVAGPPGLMGAVTSSGLVGVRIGAGLDLGQVPRLAGAGVPRLAGTGAHQRMLETATRFVRHAEEMLPDLLAFARQWRPELIIHEPTAVGARVAGAALGIPVITHRWGVDVATPVLAAADDLIADVHERYGCRPTEPDLVLDPCPSALQLPGLPPATAIRFVAYDGGGSLPDLSRRGFDPNSTALLTLGTMGDGDAGSLLVSRLLDTLRRSGIRVIAALTPAQSAAQRQTEDVAVVSAPIHALLEQVGLVIHHGGSNTTLNACRVGRPQIIIPFMRDAQITAERLAASGAGIHLPSERLDDDATSRVCRDALHDDSYRAAAGTLAHDMGQRPAPAALVPLLEDVARMPSGRHPCVSGMTSGA